MWWTLLTRILERGGVFACALLRFVLDHTNLAGTTNIVFWSDPGCHFRCHVSLTTITSIFTEVYGKHWHVNFGVGAHFKNPCDAYFSKLSTYRENAAAVNTISTISDSKIAFEAQAAEGQLLAKTAPENFVESWPPPKADVRTATYKPSSLPVAISHCYIWDAVLVDKRRKTLTGRGVSANVVTGMRLRAVLVHGAATKMEQAIFPVLRQEDAAEDDKKEEE